MAPLHHTVMGSGRPGSVVARAFGLSGEVWRPVLPLLAKHRHVVVVDLPGHGRSPMPPPGIEPHPAGYARVIGLLLDELGIDRIDVAGNSIGGWTALELALAGRASTVTALSPAGLWPDAERMLRRLRFLGEHVGVRVSAPLLRRVVYTSVGRRILLGEAISSAASLAPDDAHAFVLAYAGVKNMRAHLSARRGLRFTGGRSLAVPVTVAWGAEDRVIPKAARRRDELPADTTWLELSGCGHVMMWDAPQLVADTILAGSREPGGAPPTGHRF